MKWFPQIQIKVICSFSIFRSSWLHYICNIWRWSSLCECSRGQRAPADILSQAPTVSKLTFTIHHTAVYNSAVTSKYKPEQLILVIERKLLLMLVHFHGKFENLVKIALFMVFLLTFCKYEPVSLEWHLYFFLLDYPHPNPNFFSLQPWDMQLKWQSRKKLKVLFRLSMRTHCSQNW